jgi:hypothetical protein
VSKVRTSVLSLQAGIHLEKNKVEKEMGCELINLKKNYTDNFYRIQELERTLSACNESRLKDELENYKVFDRLNCEKITPYFMKLARAQNSSPDITKIRGDVGEVLSEVELEKHVTKFYRNLYSVPENGRVVSEQDINNFLGPISNLEPVLNSKLNQNEKVELDSPLTLLEFDKAIK